MTPTSATGSPDRHQARRAGFTLVEVLMTVAIIGLAAGAVVLSVPDSAPRPALEGERLATRLIRAREEALLTNRLVAVHVDAAGYRFAAYEGAEWIPLVDGPFGPVVWSGDGLAPTAPARFIFDPLGVAEPSSVRLVRGRTSSTISVDAAGEVRLEP